MSYYERVPGDPSPPILRRQAPSLLDDIYETCRMNPVSDIGEHMDLLRSLAEKCEHVTELGMRWANGSTVAFLAAQPETFISWDIDPAAVVSNQVANLLNVRGRTSFQPRVGDSLKVSIEQTDLLFIDTLHTYKQLIGELRDAGLPWTRSDGTTRTGHGWKVKKYIVFHDTVTYGYVGMDGKPPGLRDAIRKWQKEVSFPLWNLVEDRKNCNGLVVLKRIEP